MTVSKKLRIVLLTGIVGFLGLATADKLSTPGSSSFISPAEAIIGRPLTPFSVAGVARRTVRRCAVGVYYC
jgi:hypothetical protein